VHGVLTRCRDVQEPACNTTTDICLSCCVCVLQVGKGMGAWSADKVAGYNLEDPPMRDTTTVLFNGTTEDQAAWVAFRYVDIWLWSC
jgi:hypothetical protein